MPIHHKELASGRWNNLSLAEQLGNVGSEVSRALYWRDKDVKNFSTAVDRAFELLDFTIQDSRWRGRLKEFCRVREFLWDAVEGGKTYGNTLEDLDRYFFDFALAARRNH